MQRLKTIYLTDIRVNMFVRYRHRVKFCTTYLRAENNYIHKLPYTRIIRTIARKIKAAS